MRIRDGSGVDQGRRVPLLANRLRVARCKALKVFESVPHRNVSLKKFLVVKTPHSTRWSTRVSLPQNIEGYVTNFSPHKTLKLLEAS